MNVVALVGRLTADPELKTTSGGISVATMRIAVQRDFKSEDGKREADFFNIVAWRASADFASQYLKKGQLVSVHGRLQARSYTTQAGEKRFVVEVVTEHLSGLEKRAETAQAAATEQPEDYDPFAKD